MARGAARPARAGRAVKSSHERGGKPAAAGNPARGRSAGRAPTERSSRTGVVRGREGGGSGIRERRGYSRSFWRACAINLLCLGGIAAFLLFPKYLDSEGMPEDQIGMVEAMFWLASMGIQPFLGRRLDVLGRRRFFIGGAVLMAAAAASYLVLPVNLATMAPARGLQGLGLAMYLTALTAWIADHSPPGRLAEMLGIFGVSGLLGGTLGPIGGDYAYRLFGYHGLFVGGAAVTFVGAVLTPTLRDRFTPHPEHESQSYWRLASSPLLRGAMVGSIAFGLATGSVVAFVAPFLEDRRIEGVGVLFAVYALASGATRVYAGRLADRLGPAKVIPPSLMLQAAAMVAISFLSAEGWRSTPLLLFSAFLGGTGHGMVYPALSALAVLRLGNRFAGTGMSAVAAAVDLGSGFGAIIAGQIVLRSGYTVMFVACGLLVAACGLLCPFVERGSARAAARLENQVIEDPEEEEEEEPQPDNGQVREITEQDVAGPVQNSAGHPPP